MEKIMMITWLIYWSMLLTPTVILSALASSQFGAGGKGS
jgi:hypothetical protein